MSAQPELAALGRPMAVHWLGRIAFADALVRQEEIACNHARIGDSILLLEHEPVYTTGRGGRDENLPACGGIPVLRIGRGGDVTYHGPGQLVGYVHVDLRERGNDVHRYLRGLEEGVIRLLAALGIAGERVPGRTGVWVRAPRGAGGAPFDEARKIASIGIGVRRGITMHGFALNVGGDLAPFERIVPCGLRGVRMTSVALERPDAPGGTVEAAARIAGRVLPGALDAICPVSPVPARMEAR